MNIRNIAFDAEFIEELRRLPVSIQRRAEKARLLFIENPFHPSLRLHKLSGKLDGYWNISINLRYRILLRFQENGDTLFIAVGTHAIYD